ncbi:MAG: hypothetical protein AABZ06_13180 [Bdellovibrionota bacterium]
MTVAANQRILIGVFVTLLLISGCGKKDEGQTESSEQSPAANAPNMQGNDDDPAAETRQALAEANQGKDIKPVEMETLKSMLPADLAGMKRTNASAQHNQMMGFDMAQAEAEYQAEDSNIRITIVDYGNLSGSMKMGMAGWTMMQYNRETDTGYEKTITYKGYKGMEKYDKEAKSGSVQLFVKDRFMLTVEGNQITVDALKNAVDKIDIAKLESLV